jgi:ribose/xylose/arabinose/galactoside ABC-type transport system permease subunit
LSKHTSQWRALTQHRLFWPIAALLLVLVSNAFFGQNFFDIEWRDGHLYGVLVDVLRQGAPGIILAVGMTLVIATGGVDLSVGSVMALAGTVAAMMVTRTGLPFGVVVAATLGVATIAGLWNGTLVARVRIQPIVATLIFMVAGRGFARFLAGGQIQFTHKSFVYLANGYFLGLPFPVTIMAVLIALAAIVTRKTAVGLFIEAVGNNSTASRYSGINARTVKTLVYGFSGFCAGIAGLIDASNVQAADPSRAGEMMELDAIFAVVVGGAALTGGRFSIAGSVIGGLMLRSLTLTMYNLGVAPAVAPLPKAVVIVAVCLLQSPAFRRQIKRLFGQRRSGSSSAVTDGSAAE